MELNSYNLLKGKPTIKTYDDSMKQLSQGYDKNNNILNNNNDSNSPNKNNLNNSIENKSDSSSSIFGTKVGTRTKFLNINCIDNLRKNGCIIKN